MVFILSYRSAYCCSTTQLSRVLTVSHLATRHHRPCPGDVVLAAHVVLCFSVISKTCVVCAGVGLCGPAAQPWCSLALSSTINAGLVARPGSQDALQVHMACENFLVLLCNPLEATDTADVVSLPLPPTLKAVSIVRRFGWLVWTTQPSKKTIKPSNTFCCHGKGSTVETFVYNRSGLRASATIAVTDGACT